MQIYDILRQAQGGRAIENLAQAANVAPEQIDAAFQAIIPAFSSAIERNTLSRGGLADFVKALGDGHHEYILDNPQAMSDPRVRDDGNEILEHLLGSKDKSRNLAYQAAQASGLGEGLIKMLLPFIAQMIMGAIAKWAKGGLGDIVNKLPGGMGQGGGQGGGGGQDGGFPFPLPGGQGGGGMPFPMPNDSGRGSGGGGGRQGGGGSFELPRGEMPQGGYPMPPMPPDPDSGGGYPRQRQSDEMSGGQGGGSPFPFPFPMPGGPQQGGDGGFQIPWPRQREQPPSGGGGSGGTGGGGPFNLPRYEVPGGSGDAQGYPLPQAGGADRDFPQGQGGNPLPMPGSGGNNPYGDLSDVIRRGGNAGGAVGGGIIRNILGGLLGFGGRGIVSWIVRLLVMRFGWGLLKRLLGRMMTGR